jgi:hypothetical protein
MVSVFISTIKLQQTNKHVGLGHSRRSKRQKESYFPVVSEK